MDGPDHWLVWESGSDEGSSSDVVAIQPEVVV